MRARTPTVHQEKFIGIDVLRSRSHESTESANGLSKPLGAQEGIIRSSPPSLRIAPETSDPDTDVVVRRDLRTIFRPTRSLQQRHQGEHQQQEQPLHGSFDNDMFTIKRCLAFDEDD